MGSRYGLTAGLAASLILLGACQREPMEGAYFDEPPPPAYEPIELAGGPDPQAEAAALQASDDAYIASLASKGLMAERRIDPDTGESVLVIFNRPVPNPVLFGGPGYRKARAHGRARVRGTLGGGASTRTAVASSAASSSAAAGQAGGASSADTAPAPSVQATAPAPSPAPAVAADEAGADTETLRIADPAQAGFHMTPTIWGIIAAAVLALLAGLYLANRPKPRSSYRLSGRQAPPEATGGHDDGHGGHRPEHA